MASGPAYGWLLPSPPSRRPDESGHDSGAKIPSMIPAATTLGSERSRNRPFMSALFSQAVGLGSGDVLTVGGGADAHPPDNTASRKAEHQTPGLRPLLSAALRLNPA